MDYRKEIYFEYSYKLKHSSRPLINIIMNCSYSPNKNLHSFRSKRVLKFLFQANLKLFELCNRQLLTLVTDPKQFDYNSIRDDHK